MATVRRSLGFAFLERYGEDVVAFRNGDVTVLANLGKASVPLPAGDVIASSEPLEGDEVPTDVAVWIAG